MAISEIDSGTKTGLVSGDTEWSLSDDSTTAPGAQTADGVYQCFVDVSDMALGEVLRLRAYEKCRSGDTQRIVYEAILRDTQAEPLFVFPSLILIHGWDFTAEAISGTITINWSVRQVA
jgi:hypothetical protein